ncbi:oxidoreductase, Gfo/Idh/MocA family protein [Oceanicola granulosus HTCC2516]|uniref:Oxidoreductase, Gfo/Idh/MocA family protein n=1 Tax=Oceanicola granulosus (strain ATCC BAA-861 / DSM 15982 / KCTC 12143 / HTCC2516) TaxID=314256 RepID=Q2CIK7_OCEGH|nr:Gfo/Idh/MocA family oxidoreductase [Oceanicola granulosus]EAR52582.1 oxidoreductase, Gfo/Idh/MocA family protein [Oceanicola granulosus HTCC2516]
MVDHIRWGVLGASAFARGQMARAIHAAEGAELFALATSSPEKAEGFRAFAPRLRVHDSYEALLADPEVDAVYVPLPNHLHVDYALKSLDAGKPVLVEKPLGLRAEDFDPVIAKRNETGILAAEAYMIVHHPQMQRARELVRSGTIGDLVHADCAFAFNIAGVDDNIRNRAETGGGALPDIGVYAFGSVRFVTGEEPDSILDASIRFENDVDTFAQVSARFPSFHYSGMVSTRAFARQRLTFHGTKGLIELTCPFNANVHDLAELHLQTDSASRTIERWPTANHYVLQVEAFGRALRGEEAYPCPLEFSRGTQEMIDMVYAAARR